MTYIEQEGSLSLKLVDGIYVIEAEGGDLSLKRANGADFVDNSSFTFTHAEQRADGGYVAELRDVFAQRGIAEWFDGGIFGSPDPKDEILARELAAGNIQQSALFLGDSKYDYQAASAAGLDFVFLSGWSEVADWEAWVSANGLIHVSSVQALVDNCSLDGRGLH